MFLCLSNSEVGFLPTLYVHFLPEDIIDRLSIADFLWKEDNLKLSLGHKADKMIFSDIFI